MLRFGEFVADAVTEAERIGDIVPIGATEFERNPLRVDPLAVRITRIVGDAERPEVDVLDVADIITFVDENTPLDRIAGDIADNVPMGANEFDPLVRIQEAAVADAHVFRVFGQDTREDRERAARRYVSTRDRR